ncbi:aldo/keto reductase [Paenibacillus sp. CC-CFT747]|nr:aldo/keto reductase [Paenibacillus sp. CC-CFT747]
MLQECVQAGLVDKVGVSLANHVDQEFEAIWPSLQDDLYELVQIPFNVLDQRLIRTGALEKLRQSGKLVLARSAYLQGLIFLEDERLPDHLKHAAPWLAKLRRLAERERMSMAELAFAYVRDTPGITSVLVGAETPEQVRNNVGLLKAKPVSEQTRAEIEKEFLHVPDSIIVPTLWNLWKNTSK